jgi:hypothetical protein
LVGRKLGSGSEGIWKPPVERIGSQGKPGKVDEELVLESMAEESNAPRQPLAPEYR